MNRDGVWRKASKSVFEGQCLEAAATDDEVRVRDSADPAGPVLHFSPGAWIVFTEAIKADNFELPARSGIAQPPGMGGYSEMGDGVMPKEVIYDMVGMYDVVVGWTTDNSVQVGIETHGGKPVVQMLNAGAEEQPPDHLADFTGLWGTFDREAINRLIRHLRRARDQAYGRDE